MKNTVSVIFLFLFLFGFSVNIFHGQEAPSAGLQQITEPLLKEWIDFLASDEMRGRPAPGIEADRAAGYIAAKLNDFGIKPVNGSYLQQIPFCSSDLNPENCKFTISTGGTTHDFDLKEQYTPLFQTGNDRVKGGLVFAGYGITMPEYDYDDYKNVDVKGKIVLVMKQAPRKNDPASPVFEGAKETEYSSLAYKIRNAAAHGATGFLLVTDPLHNIAITAQGYLWNSLYMKEKAKPIFSVCEEGKKIPAVQVNRDVINVLFGSVDSLRTLQRKIDETMQPNSFIVPEMWIDLAVSTEKEAFPSSNVIGWIEGADPLLKEEYIVLGAHYDHIGVTSKPNHENDSIMNGADDNASGTAAVMAVAKAFAGSVKKPARSILFMLFTNEEGGLVGSDYYTRNPLFPLERTVAMINLDMVGRNGNDTVYVVGEKYNPGLAALFDAAIPENGLKKEEMEIDLYQSSDYYPFHKNGIPAIGLTSGLHKDYHQVGDSPDKINHLKVKKIAQLAFNVTWQIANTNNYYTKPDQ